MPDKPALPERKHLDLSVSQTDALYPLMHALSSAQRMNMLVLLGSRSMYVNELAERLDMPVSTAAHNVRILEEAGIITCELQPGVRGTMKLCTRRLDSLNLSLLPAEEHRDTVYAMSLPVGCYSLAEGIVPTCGLAGAHAAIGEDDNPRSFFCQDHFQAQLIWFRHGHVTYHFSILRMQDIDVLWLELSFEACSEAPMYRDPWKSDIDIAINGKPVAVWTCPADFGGRRGILTPEWWSDMSTQHGLLKTLRVDAAGTSLDGVRISDTTIGDLALVMHPYIAVRIGVAADAEHVGGINLFGQGFGDFAQDIVLRVGYSIH
jgi:predicted transcriptional regulator